MSDPIQPPVVPSVPTIDGATVTVETRQSFGRAAPWLKFLGVVASIGIGVVAALGVGSVVVGVRFSSLFEEKSTGFFVSLLGIFYVVIAGVFFFPARMLLRLAKASRRYFADPAAASLEAVAVHLRKLATFYGVVTIVFLALYALIILAVVLVVLFFNNQFSIH